MVQIPSLFSLDSKKAAWPLLVAVMNCTVLPPLSLNSDGPGGLNHRLVNQESPSIFKPQQPKGHLWPPIGQKPVCHTNVGGQLVNGNKDYKILKPAAHILGVLEAPRTHLSWFLVVVNATGIGFCLDRIRAPVAQNGRMLSTVCIGLSSHNGFW